MKKTDKAPAYCSAVEAETYYARKNKNHLRWIGFWKGTWAVAWRVWIILAMFGFVLLVLSILFDAIDKNIAKEAQWKKMCRFMTNELSTLQTSDSFDSSLAARMEYERERNTKLLLQTSNTLYNNFQDELREATNNCEFKPTPTNEVYWLTNSLMWERVYTNLSDWRIEATNGEIITNIPANMINIPIIQYEHKW